MARCAWRRGAEGDGGLMLGKTFGYYHGNRYVVRDWQHDHLSQPSYGYEWVQDGDQCVLIAIATGIVTDVILNAMNQ